MDISTLSPTQLQEEFNRLKAENDKLLAAKAAKVKPLDLKIGEKGGVSVTGLGRFPTTLYAQQWARLAAFMPEVLAFIEKNKAKLSYKD